MRLIDADALVRVLEGRFERFKDLVPNIDNSIEFAHNYALNSVTNAPTISEGWIPCSERLPSDSGDYLVWLEDESEHYAVIPFDADAEDFGWWQDYYHPVSLGFLDSAFIKAENVTAWQSLPKPYREESKVEE